MSEQYKENNETKTRESLKKDDLNWEGLTYDEIFSEPKHKTEEEYTMEIERLRSMLNDDIAEVSSILTINFGELTISEIASMLERTSETLEGICMGVDALLNCAIIRQAEIERANEQKTQQ